MTKTKRDVFYTIVDMTFPPEVASIVKANLERDFFRVNPSVRDKLTQPISDEDLDELVAEFFEEVDSRYSESDGGTAACW